MAGSLTQLMMPAAISILALGSISPLVGDVQCAVAEPSSRLAGLPPFCWHRFAIAFFAPRRNIHRGILEVTAIDVGEGDSSVTGKEMISTLEAPVLKCCSRRLIGRHPTSLATTTLWFCA
jgi:hypothetical protein